MRYYKLADFLELALPIIFLIYYSILYIGVGLIASSRSVDYGAYLSLSLDLKFPFIPFFIIPYMCAWVCTPLCIYYMVYYKSIYLLRRISICMLALSTLLALFYIALPVHYPYRIDMSQLKQPSFFLNMILYNYQSQPAWNEFPSSHIAFPWLTLRILNKQFQNKVTLLFNIYFGFLAVSVIAIKIHFILDILAGIAVAELIYQGIFKKFDQYQFLYKIQSRSIFYLSFSFCILVLFTLTLIQYSI